MSKLLLLALVVIGCLVAANGQFDTHGYPQMQRVVKAICGPHLSADKKHIVDECTKLIPSQFRAGYAGCVKQVFHVSKFTKPAICFAAGSGQQKLKPCLQRKLQAAAKHLPPGVDGKALRQQLIQEYQACMIKVL